MRRQTPDLHTRLPHTCILLGSLHKHGRFTYFRVMQMPLGHFLFNASSLWTQSLLVFILWFKDNLSLRSQGYFSLWNPGCTITIPHLPPLPTFLPISLSPQVTTLLQAYHASNAFFLPHSQGFWGSGHKHFSGGPGPSDFQILDVQS